MLTEKQPSAIEKIRAEVGEIRKEHIQVAAAGRCQRCWHFGERTWPCPTLRLAEDKLKLVLAIEEMLDEGQYIGHDEQVREIAERVLAEVAR